MIAYRCRLSLLQKEVQYELAHGALAFSDGPHLSFAHIASIRIYDIRGGSMNGARRCVIRPVRGRAVIISSLSFQGLGRFEDRGGEFQSFVDALIGQVAAENPKTKFIAGMPLALLGLWLVVLASAAVILPLSMGLLLVPLLGDSGLAAFAGAMCVLATMAFLLFYFVRSLKADWPHAFDPRAR